MASETTSTARFFDGANVRIAADVAGPPDGATVVLLHGGGQTRHSWGAAVQEGARRGFRMISLDLRGHGDSGWSTEGDYTLDAYAADLGAVVATLDRPPVLVGASLGGLTSLMFAGEGGATRGLVLVDVAPRIEPDGAARIGGFMRARPEGFADLAEAADFVAAYLPHRKRPADRSGLMKNLRQDPDGRLRWHWDPKMMSGRGPGPDAARLEAAARALTVPALLIRGRLSDVVSAEGAQAFLELTPRARLVDIADAEHMVAGDKNDAFNAAVFTFLAELA